MFWCLLTPAAICATLGLLSLTLDLRHVRPPRLSPSQVLRGCLSSSFLLIAGCLVALAYLVQA